ncbi:MAG: transposase [Ferruginibacter sp.]|nr:transposase [Cytophagales bacterium]
MPTLPDEFLSVILPYAQLFCKRIFAHVQVLLTGAVLTPGKRTVTSVLRIMGLSQTKAFHKYHCVLSQAQWSALAAIGLLLSQLLAIFIGQQPVVVGIDETLERRWGKGIAARGIYRDAVRSSGSHFVKCSGLRWVSVMLLTRVSWANRVWALPFLTALAPSQRYYSAGPRPDKKFTDWARQLLLQVKRWAGDRQVVAVGDSSYAVIDLLKSLQGRVSLISRLRLDAALYEPVPPPLPGQRGRKPLKGKRLPTLLEMAGDGATPWPSLQVADWYGGPGLLFGALLRKAQQVEHCTGTAVWYHTGKQPVAIRWVMVRLEGKLTGLVSNDARLTAGEMIGYFVRRWSIETTFALVRSHLGVETQRQWSELAIARTTPVLLGLFSLVTLMADSLQKQGQVVCQVSSWYVKDNLTFSDALAAVRRCLWQEMNFCTSAKDVVHVKMSQQQFQLWQNALAWAA